MNDDRGFNLDRAYLGYQYDLSKELQLKVVADFGQSKSVDDHQRIGFVKNAQISWKREKWTLHAGLISTTQFKFQESFWGKRYVMKSFQDEYKFGSSADLAVSAAYDFNDYVSADVILANGEGYKKLQVKDGLQYGAGVTLMPVKNLFIRLYGSYNEASEESGKGITNLASFMDINTSHFLWLQNIIIRKMPATQTDKTRAVCQPMQRSTCLRKSESLVVGTILLQKTNGMKRMMVWQDL